MRDIIAITVAFTNRTAYQVGHGYRRDMDVAVSVWWDGVVVKVTPNAEKQYTVNRLIGS